MSARTRDGCFVIMVYALLGVWALVMVMPIGVESPKPPIKKNSTPQETLEFFTEVLRKDIASNEKLTKKLEGLEKEVKMLRGQAGFVPEAK